MKTSWVKCFRSSLSSANPRISPLAAKYKCPQPFLFIISQCQAYFEHSDLLMVIRLGYDGELFRLVDFSLTDFWGTCCQSSFRQDHERSFWAERIIPFFKYFGVSSSVLFSWCEDHCIAYSDNQKTPGAWNTNTKNYMRMGLVGATTENLEDSMKLINIMVSTLNIAISSKLDTKLETVLGLAVFGVQLIRNRLTLLKTTLDPNGKKLANRGTQKRTGTHSLE
ncbi:hypothetical protein [Absidia glauca]|uniref:Ndc10 domain-containing protein n=1 Tax=Absidia glauca TaxID=4829 RepID=A0A168NK29_ABSGL|nr:hypothetical protein [Absidia glauca]